MVKDILTMVNLLETLGKKIKIKKNKLEIISKNKKIILQNMSWLKQCELEF